MNKVFTCVGFTGHHSFGTAAVIIARDEATARQLLNAALALEKLPLTEKPLRELSRLGAGFAAILCNGDC